MIKDHGYHYSCARTVRRDQNLLPDQRSLKIVHLEGYVRNCLDHLGVQRIRIEPHPLNAARASFKSRDVNAKVGHVNLILTRGLRRDANVVIPPAILGNCGWRLVVLSQVVVQWGAFHRSCFHLRFEQAAPASVSRKSSDSFLEKAQEYSA